jgi:hypothetical protein
VNQVTKVVLAICAIVGLAAVLLGFVMWTASSEAQERPGAQYLLAEEPESAINVKALRDSDEELQDVVVVGRIGGRTDPWVQGLAAFPIVDRALTPCSEMEGDSCPTPWDYCCESTLPNATVLVTIVDDDGKPIKRDARELLGVKELQTVVVQGRAKRDAAGNVTVLASKLHIRPEGQAAE